MIALLLGRVQAWLMAAVAVFGALLAIWFNGRRSGGERVRASAQAQEQELRREGDEAAADAGRAGASDRLRSGRF
jgi:hypothetical protein